MSIPIMQTMRNRLMLVYWERLVNGLVYELCFPDELHAAGLRLFDPVAQAQMPVLASLPEADRLPRLRQKFAELHPVKRDAHPLRIALDKLQTLDTVRIIESKA
ncbi:MAG TPA: hypothetical protein VMS21_00145 [Methylomirabilota bacterium]|nr:hypothetical protein [Methylomirabilota bacterium]